MAPINGFSGIVDLGEIIKATKFAFRNVLLNRRYTVFLLMLCLNLEKTVVSLPLCGTSKGVVDCFL